MQIQEIKFKKNIYTFLVLRVVLLSYEIMDTILALKENYLTFRHVAILVLFLAAVYLLKYPIRRRKYSKLLPSSTQYFIDILGDLRNISYREKFCKKTTILLEYISAIYQFYKDVPVFIGWISYLPFVFVNKPEAIEEVLSGTRIIEKSWFYRWLHCWIGTGLLTRRRKYSKFLPSTTQYFIDILGDLRKLSHRDKLCKETTILLETISAHFHLYKDAPVYITWFSYIPFVGVSKPEAIEEVLSGTRIIEKSWFYKWMHCWIGTGLLTSHGDKWKSRRKLLTPSFHFDILKDFLPTIDEKSRILVRKLEKECIKEYTDIVPFLTLCSLDIICETTLGINIKAQEDEESEYVKAVARISDGLTKRAIYPSRWIDFIYFLTSGKDVKKALKTLHKFTISVIQAKKEELSSRTSIENKKSKRKPLIDVLLEHHIETKELTDEDIREEVDTFTFEGHDTTSMALTYTLYLIGLYKEVQDKVHEEIDLIFGEDRERPVTTEDLGDMKYLECVIKESMRLYPPVPLIGRNAQEDLTICNSLVPKGSSLVMCPYEFHRNEEIYPDPEIFDPERFTPENSRNRHPFAYIPFSAGPRNCIGQRFAMMELKTVIANILRRYTLGSLDTRDKLLTCFELTLRPAGQVRIKIRQRK